MKKNILYSKNGIIPLSIGVVAFAFLICFAVSAWTEPSVAPPGGNVPAPLHVGLCSDSQILQKADGYNWNCVAMPGGGSGEPGDFDCEDCDTRFVNITEGNIINESLTINESLAVEGIITVDGIYLNATGDEGGIYKIKELVGYDDLFIKSNEAENRRIYIAGREIKMYTNGSERLSIDSRGDVKISNGILVLPYLPNCAYLATGPNGEVICSAGAPPGPGPGPGPDPCAGVSCPVYCVGNVLNYNGHCVNGTCQYSNTETCAYGCSNGYCKPDPGAGLLPIGASCSNNSQCQSGYCSGGVCAEPPGDKKGLGESCSAASQCQSGYCVDGVCCNNACTGRDCQTCGALSSQRIGHCGYVKSSSADPRNDCSSGSTVSNGCKSDNCSGKGWSCGIVASGQDGGCPVCKTCDGVNASCKNYPEKTRDQKGPKTCYGCKYCVSGACKDIPSFTDPFNECEKKECNTGDCGRGGECNAYVSGERGCPVCQTCDGPVSLKCKYIGAGQKDDQGSKLCNNDHKRCNGSGSCHAPTSANQTGCLNLGSNNCSGYCPGWCASESMCKSCMVPSMRVFSNNSCSGVGSGVFSGSCNQSGGGCKCFYVKYEYPY